MTAYELTQNRAYVRLDEAEQSYAKHADGFVLGFVCGLIVCLLAAVFV